MEAMHRDCRKCGEVKPLEEFAKQKSCKLGRRPYCKSCERAKRSTPEFKAWLREWKKKPEQVEKRRQYSQSDTRKEVLRRHAQTAAFKSTQRTYREANPDVGLAWVAANPDKVRGYKRKWQHANPDAQVEWAKVNPERVRIYKKKWREAHPEACRVHVMNRRARLRGAVGRHTAAEVKELFQRQHGRCAACKAALSSGYHKDHIVALANGGTNDILNIQLLCGACNCRKGAKDPIQFAQSLGMLL
jgi:hypothetical protein